VTMWTATDSHKLSEFKKRQKISWLVEGPIKKDSAPRSLVRTTQISTSTYLMRRNKCAPYSYNAITLSAPLNYFGEVALPCPRG
jgi:hypothetical protein